MPRLFLCVFLFLLCSFTLQAKEEKYDTTIVRLRYAGFYLSFRNSFSPQLPYYIANQQPDTNVRFIYSLRSGQLFDGGVFITQPFARRWDAELGIGLNLRYQETVFHTITNGPVVIEEQESYELATQLTARFSRELLRNERTALYVGAGSWVVIRTRAEQPGYFGLDGGVDLYYRTSPHWALRLRVTAGQQRMGSYYGIGIAYCHVGEYMMHVKEKPKYIRTYDPGE